MKVLKWVILSWVLCVGAAAAQAPDQGIIVTGEGRISGAPDMATITLGVTENAETAGDVMAEVSASVAGILSALEGLGIAPEDRQTSGFYLQPVHNNRASSDNAAPKIVGYRAGNTVTVRVRDLAALGDLMDAVIEIGANNFNGLRFGLQDTSEAMAQARAAAVADAMTRAKQLADAAGLKLGQVTRMSESAHQGAPMMMEMAAARSSMSDAIATGEVDVVATVTMVFAIAPGQ